MSKRNHEVEVTPTETGLVAAIIAVVTDSQPSGCWTLSPDRRAVETEGRLLRISQNNMGYAQMWWNGRQELVHAIVLAAKRSTKTRSGKVYPGEDVLHSCDNHECLNPDHIRGGTAAENAEDRARNGKVGDSSNRSPLTDKQKSFVKYLALKKLVPGKALAELAGISQPSISSIRKGELWSQIEPAFILVEDIPLFFGEA